MPRFTTQEEWNYWYNRVYGYFYRRLSDRFQVEELTAETLNDFFLSEKEIESQQGFMWRVARCKFLDYLRSKRARKNQWHTYENIEEIEEDLSYNTYYLERLEALKNCLRRNLKEQDCRIVEMCVMYDFSSQEAAVELQMSADSIRQRLSRGLKKIKDKCRQIWTGQTA